jgi:lipopolysaccharide transport system permease protein
VTPSTLAPGGAPARRLHLAYLWDLLAVLVGRDIKLRYKRSFLGLAWSLLNPLAQFLVLNFVFSTVLPLNIADYTPFLFTGLLAWNWFSTSLLLATNAIVENRDLIRRPGFPPAVLPLIAVVSNLIHFLLALPILAVFLLVSGEPPRLSVLWLPAIIAVQFLLSLSLSYFLATIQVTFRDTQYLLSVALLLGFYLTPVFYSLATVPARYHLAYQLNPMVHLLDAYRAALLGEGNLPLGALAVISLAAALLLLVGYRVFMRASYHFAEEL